MPKVVDLPARRQQIVEATWRLIARQGIAATTMRELAAELGLANGALLTYFPNKRAILEAAWSHVFAATNDRFRTSGAGLRGTRALRAFLTEVMPLDEGKALEARIVIAFWERAALDAEFAAVHDAAMRQWRDCSSASSARRSTPAKRART